jgi:hypothetical protein
MNQEHRDIEQRAAGAAYKEPEAVTELDATPLPPIVAVVAMVLAAFCGALTLLGIW